MRHSYCARTYTNRSGKIFVCVRPPHREGQGHHFVQANTTPSSTAAMNFGHKSEGHGSIITIPGERR